MLLLNVVITFLLLMPIWTLVCSACAATAPPSHPTTLGPTIPTVTPTSAPEAIKPRLWRDLTCGTSCTQVVLQMDSENSRPINQIATANVVNGCPGFTLDCAGTADDSVVIFTWYKDGKDVGSTFGTGTVNAVVACAENNVLTLEGTVVDTVECISA
ncbi:unnamed protein product [Bursaphelenchus okinawaensis]|uniref:Ig-like domain-containing protein n=1 Tax=Bursaphelenchus okinawaensis TaxID=465554 RepID=A0A811LP59_9BILA|nr:unnamed protein product [Bursaphelenchus okinawaensis]CAG9125190.1 unnamed protein product [Bursaphelenchus okinawaensis]